MSNSEFLEVVGILQDHFKNDPIKVLVMAGGGLIAIVTLWIVLLF